MPDRSTGIWDHVWTFVTGPVLVDHPHVVSRLVSEAGSWRTFVQLAAEVRNATEKTVSGALSYDIESGGDVATNGPAQQFTPRTAGVLPAGFSRDGD
jgi:hypothetical protein